MARIAGVDLPRTKRVEIALSYIHGIGRSSATKILAETGVDPGKKVSDLTDAEVAALRKAIESGYKVEGVLRAEVRDHIKRLIEIGCHKGTRHKRGLPVRGQRTRTNARTRKGPKKSSGVLKKKRARGGE
ncbi:30S ribosomal protein S13 [candidate division TA06 bacterium DG_26]|uniref:Small ribosomal subunit protein uS13 n=1 Tax=candidate division TA06 bacterium DG_26 TaxID=1703771 RepID=A0A0S7WIX3_UNCT6|nr:MAG: 30S ribosomal protein S13 [candidate division TA06 bacterium DG_26]